MDNEENAIETGVGEQSDFEQQKKEIKAKLLAMSERMNREIVEFEKTNNIDIVVSGHLYKFYPEEFQTEQRLQLVRVFR